MLHHGQPLLFRTLQRGVDTSSAYASALAAELQRTLAFIGAGDEDSAQIYLIGHKDDLGEVASVLAETLSSSVSIASVLDRVDDSDVAPLADAASYANLIGVACAMLDGQLGLNFAQPREPAKPPSPWRRVAFWSSIAAAVLAFFGYIIYDERARQLDSIETKTYFR